MGLKKDRKRINARVEELRASKARLQESIDWMKERHARELQPVEDEIQTLTDELAELELWSRGVNDTVRSIWSS